MPDNTLRIVVTSVFARTAAAIPLSEETLEQLRSDLQANPEAGDMVPGAGGVRKIRVRSKGRGKSGGARVIYFYAQSRTSILLLFAFGKSNASDLSPSGKKQMKAFVGKLLKEMDST